MSRFKPPNSIVDVWPGYFDVFGLWHYLGEKERSGEAYFMCREHNKGCTWCGMPFEGLIEPKECRCGLELLWRDPNPSGEFCDDCFDEA